MPRPQASRRAWTATITLALLTALAAPAAADPSATDVQREKQRATQLEQRARQQAGDVRAAKAQLDAATGAANAALDAFSQAQQASQRAAQAAAAAQKKLEAAQQRTAKSRQRLADYAGSVYRSGPMGSELSTLLSLVDGDPSQFSANLALLGQVGNAQGDVLHELQVAQHAQNAASQQAANTARVAKGAADQARTKKERADRLVAQQASLVRTYESRLAQTRTAASQARQNASALEQAWNAARARERAMREAAARARAAAARTSPLCTGGDVSGYPNGQLPTSALCPLWGAPGEVLIASAANAYNRMSHAYAATFGSPICVADAYRTYSEQVYMKQTRGSFAATPGTSNHGWGRAVDLCGGIQTDGTAQNNWMRMHAPSFGWFHPSWADPGGPGPYEPWHWEFAG